MKTKMEKEGVETFIPDTPLLLLRAYAEMCGLWVNVKGETATVCIKRSAEEELTEHIRNASKLYDAEDSVDESDVGEELFLAQNWDERRGGDEEYEVNEGDGKKCKVRRVVISAEAFRKLRKGKFGSEEERTNGWDAVAWILVWMELDALDLKRCNLKSKHVVPIGKLVTLTELVLPRFCSFKEVDLTPLGALVRLETLDISRTRLRTIQPISGITTLRNLKMRGCGLELADLTSLGHLPQLTKLILSYNALGLRAIEVISGIKSLRILVMDNCSLKRVDLTLLGNMGDLRELDLSSNDMSREEIERQPWFSRIPGLVLVGPIQ